MVSRTRVLLEGIKLIYLRSVLGIIVSISMFAGVAHSATNYQDSWWNPNQSGMGVMVVHQGNTVAAAWYHFGSDGKATYLLLSGPLNGNSVSGSLRRSTGPQPGPGYSASAVAETSVGTATMTFTSSTTATLTYSFEGRAGVLELTRFSFAEPDLNGSWSYGAQATMSQCTNPANNGVGFGMGTLTMARNGNSLAVTLTPSGGSGQTVFSLQLARSGSLSSASGTFTCCNGMSGTASFTDMRSSDDFVSTRYALSYTQGETCQESGSIGALRSN